MDALRCRRCNSPLGKHSAERTWENACSECQQPVWLWKDDVLTTTVVLVTDDKVVLGIKPGIDGQLLFTENDLRNLRQHVSVGQRLRVAVLDVDPWERQILLRYCETDE